MSEKKMIAVLGATGAQGGGLAEAILSDPEGGFGLRAITRNPDSDKARALAARGAEVVQADLDDVESLAAAFDGCYGVFGLTNFWEHFSPEKETQQGRNIAEAAKRAGVSHAIWSTFEDVRDFVPLDSDQMPTLMERYKVPHFDAKAEADQAFSDAGVPTTFLLTSFYWDNLIFFGLEPQRGEDGSLTFTLPMGDERLPGIAVEDIGRCAYGIFKSGDAFVGKTVGIAGEHLTGAEMASALSETFGETVNHFSPPFDVYRSFGFPGAEDMGNMFQFKHDFAEAYQGSRVIEQVKELNPGLMSFRAWLEKHGERIPRH